MEKFNHRYSAIKVIKIRQIRAVGILFILILNYCCGMFLGGTGGKNVASSNYITVSRISLKNGDITTLTPQGWLNRALKGVGFGKIK